MTNDLVRVSEQLTRQRMYGPVKLIAEVSETLTSSVGEGRLSQLQQPSSWSRHFFSVSLVGHSEACDELQGKKIRILLIYVTARHFAIHFLGATPSDWWHSGVCLCELCEGTAIEYHWCWKCFLLLKKNVQTSGQVKCETYYHVDKTSSCCTLQIYSFSVCVRVRLPGDWIANRCREKRKYTFTYKNSKCATFI